jgi:hypothetical protein
LTDRLTLSEVLHDADLTSNKFLKHVSDCTVNEIPNKLLEISITDMFSEEVYGADAIKYEGETPILDINSKEIKNGEYYTITDGNITKVELKGTWWYLLNDPNGVNAPSDYKAAADMNALISNMTTNVQNAKMYALKNDGIIEGLDDVMLNTLVRDSITGTIEGVEITYNLALPDRADIVIGTTTMGELTVTEMLAYTSSMMTALTALGL